MATETEAKVKEKVKRMYDVDLGSGYLSLYQFWISLR